MVKKFFCSFVYCWLVHLGLQHAANKASECHPEFISIYHWTYYKKHFIILFDSVTIPQLFISFAVRCHKRLFNMNLTGEDLSDLDTTSAVVRNVCLITSVLSAYMCILVHPCACAGRRQSTNMGPWKHYSAVPHSGQKLHRVPLIYVKCYISMWEWFEDLSSNLSGSFISIFEESWQLELNNSFLQQLTLFTSAVTLLLLRLQCCSW